MNSNLKLVWTVSLFAVIGIILFQSYWLYNVYAKAKSDFQKEISKSLTESIARDFSLRSNFGIKPKPSHDCA